MSQRIDKLLTADSPHLQLQGIKLALNTNSPHYIPKIFELTKASEPEVSKLAQSSAIKLSLDLLKTGTEKQKTEQSITAAVQTVNKLDPSYVLHLNYLVEDGQPDDIIDALIVLKYFVTEKRAEEILKITLRNQNRKVRATAVKHIGEVASRVNADVLARFLEDSDNRVKANTIEVFENLNNKYFVRILNRFRQDPNNRVRANTLKALFKISDTDINPDLKEMLLSPKALFRASAVWVIGEIGEASSTMLKLLKLVQDDPDEMVQNNLLIVIKKLGNNSEVDFLRDSMREVLKNKLKSSLVNKKELSIEQIQRPDYLVLQLRGILTAQTILTMKFTVDELVPKENAFVLDFRDLEYIDSSGVGFLINFQKRVKQHDGFVYVFGCQFKILEMMQISKIDTVLSIFNSIQEINEFLGVEA